MKRPPTRSASRGLAAFTTALIVGTIGILTASANTAARGLPQPAFHDEHSYLLAADTFRRGRLANPTPDRPRHFATHHVLLEPTYASKYPPAQGLALAAGWIVGHPAIGTWLAVGSMGGALFWMLLGFVPRRWAVAGAVVAAVQLGWNTYWGHGYWGGAVPAIGGALLFGALPRLLRRASATAGAALALGLVVLANSRPFEGLLAALLALAILLRGGLHGGTLQRTSLLRTALPAAGLVLILGAAATLVYHRAVTGSALTLPYGLHERQVAVVPLFLWQDPAAPPAYDHDVLARFQTELLVGMYRLQQTAGGYFELKGHRLAHTWSLLCGPLLTLPMLLALARPRDHRVRLAVLGLATFLAGAAVTTYLEPHYAAPFVPLLWLLVVQGLRRLRLALRHRIGARRRRAAATVLAATLLVAVATERTLRIDPFLAVAATRGVASQRPAIEERLEGLGGRHLVLVEYGARADLHDEWVANGADLAEQTVLWARSMSHGDDAALRRAYPGRRAWRVRIGVTDPRAIDVEELRPEDGVRPLS